MHSIQNLSLISMFAPFSKGKITIEYFSSHLPPSLCVDFPVFWFCLVLIFYIRHLGLMIFIPNPKYKKRLRLTDVENKPVVTSEERKGRRGEIEV